MGDLRNGEGDAACSSQAREQQPTDHTQAALSAVASLFRGWFLRFADMALGIPHLPSAVRFLFFYTFAQALGLLWGFMVIMLQVLSQRLVEVLLSETSVAEGGPLGALRLIGRLYLQFASLRILFLFAGSLWTLAWEASSDFQTVRKLLLMSAARRGSHSSLPTLTPLLVPTLVITLVFAVSSVVPMVCSHTGSCGDGWMTEQLLTNDGHGNRMLRFSLVILLLQWGQLFEGLSPAGVLGLVSEAPWRRRALAVLVPVSFLRLSQFVWRPSDHVFFGNAADVWISRHLYDNLLACLWGSWLTMAVAWAPSNAEMEAPDSCQSAQPRCVRRMASAPLLHLLAKDAHPADCDSAGNLGAAGVLQDAAWPQEAWTKISWRFQYTFVFSVFTYWLRSAMSPHIGWTFAQNDLMALCTLYPSMFVLVWSATYMCVALGRVRPRWAVGAFCACGFAAVAVWPGVQMALAMLHMMRQVTRLLGQKSVRYATHAPRLGSAQLAGWLASWERQRSGESPPRLTGEAGLASVGQSSSSGKHHEVERKWALRCAHLLGFILVAFFCILSTLMLLSAAQKQIGFFPGHMEFTVTGQPGNETLHVAHKSIIGSYLTLTPDPGAKPPPSSYAICDQTFGGLTALDYALLSMAAYWDADDPQLPTVLGHLFPASSGRGATVLNGSAFGPTTGHGMPWLEVELREPRRRVLAVRGTDPTKISDVVEDIRMWTEPVVLGILKIVFPTVHVWPGPLVDNWVFTTHGMLKALEMEAGPWMWEPLAAHLRSAAASQNTTDLPMLTGHSLGAGIAQVAAALTGASVVAISPPGLLESFMKHWQRSGGGQPPASSSTVRAAHRRSVSVVVEDDWVSRFDSHAGFVQTIACDRSDLAMFGGCHLIESTICQILTECGDARQRWQRCQHTYTPHSEAWSLLVGLPSQVIPIVRGWAAGWSSDAAVTALCAALAVGLLFPASLRRTEKAKAL